MRKIADVVLITVLITAVRADTPKEFHSRIETARGERNYGLAIEELQKLQRQQPIVFSANSYDYLLARIAEQAGDFPLAMTNYQAVIFRKSILREYAYWHLSQIARTTGNLTLERLYLLEITMLFPDGILAGAAQSRTQRSLFESSEFGRMLAEKQFTQPDSIFKSGGRLEDVRSELEKRDDVLTGKALMYTGETEKARVIFDRLNTESDPARPDEIALEGIRGLDLLDGGPENYQRLAAELSEAEHKRRGDIYQFNREFEMARLHYLAIVNRHSTDELVPEAIFGIGIGFSRRRDFVTAISWFERLLEQYPEHELASEGLLQAASAYGRIGKFREAVSRYHKFLEKYPTDNRIGRANLNAAAVLRDHGEETEALKFAVAAGGLAENADAARGLFTEARIYIARENWEAALGAIERLAQMSLDGLGGLPDGTNPREAAFLRGFILEQLRRYDEAINVYLALPDGRDEYYGGLATARLRLMAENSFSAERVGAKRGELAERADARDPETRRQGLQALIRVTASAEERKGLLAALGKTYSEIEAYSGFPRTRSTTFWRREIRTSERSSISRDRHLAVADELAFLSLFDEAAPEFEASRSKDAAPRMAGSDIEISNLYLLGGSPVRAMTLAAAKLQKVPADFQIELLPTDAVRLGYPTPFADEVLKYSKQYGVDPRFVLAVMRQESRFHPEAHSNAAARGLLQFITETAAKIATETGRTAFEPKDLYDPATSIRFGAKYISDLFRLFPNQPEAVAAAYNGGEDNIKRWMGRANSPLPERYVPEIAFGQTKEYVYKVMANYRVYTALYDENLRLKSIGLAD